jgi:hypothetical protein
MTDPDPAKVVRDDQTGVEFELTHEHWWDTVAAIISIVYLLSMLVFCGWLLIDIWSRAFQFAPLYSMRAQLSAPIFRLMAYSALGGALGGTIDGIRSFVNWHAERKSFGWRFIWKYLALPLQGAALAVIVYAVVRGGIAAFSGGLGTAEGTVMASLFALATGALAGYGSRQVFVWLDKQVSRLFQTTEDKAKISVPDLTNKTEEEARQILTDLKLKLGSVTSEAQENAERVGKVIRQKPLAKEDADESTAVDVTIGAKKA